MTLENQIHYLKIYIDMISNPFHEHHADLWDAKSKLAKLEKQLEETA